MWWLIASPSTRRVITSPSPPCPPHFTPLPTTLPPPAIGGDNTSTRLHAADFFDGQLHLTWRDRQSLLDGVLIGGDVVLQTVQISDVGLVAGDVYSLELEGGAVNQRVPRSFVRINDTTYLIISELGITTLRRVDISGSSFTLTTQPLTGDSLAANFSSGATAVTEDGSIYIVGDLSDFLDVYRLSDTFELTNLSAGVVNAGDNVEAALAHGADIYAFGVSNQRVFRGVITGDSITMTELTGLSVPSTVFRAALTT